MGPIIITMMRNIKELTVSPAVPLHWLMSVLSSASSISTTFHHLIQPAGGYDDDHGVGAGVVDVDFDVVDDEVDFIPRRPGSPHW